MVSAPVRVARVSERGPVRVRGGIHAFREFSDERLQGSEARRGTVLQSGGKVESAIAMAWFARNLDARRIGAPGTKEAPEPAERRGRDRLRRGALGGQWERVYGEDVGRDRGEWEILGTG